MKRLVIDASVVLAWYLADENLSSKALDLLEKYISNEVVLIGPSLLEYEVLNGLIIAQRRGRIKTEIINKALEGFLNLNIELKGISSLYPKIMTYCQAYNLSAYDASYLVLASEEGIPLVTADEALFKAVGKELSWVKFIG